MKELICAALLLVSASPVPAQLPARGMFVGIGAQKADIEELNARLAANGYPTFSEDFFAFSAGHNWWARSIAFSIDATGLFQPSETNATHRTSLTGAYATLSLGVPIRATRNLVLYPMASVGGGGAQLHIQSRSDVSFDQLLADPGRTANVSNASLLFGPRIGVHYMWRRGERDGVAHGIAFGIRAGYLFSAVESDWGELDGENVNGGPSATLAGPQLLITIGGWGERRPRRSR